MQFINKMGKAIDFTFAGIGVTMVSNGPQWAVSYAHRSWINGECFQGPGRYDTREEAARVALQLSRHIEMTGTFFGMSWDRIPSEDDRTVMVRAFKAYRSRGLKPAVAIEYARNQVAFSRNGW